MSCKRFQVILGVPRAPRGESFDSGNKVFIHASEKQHGRPPVLAAARSEARRRYDWGTHCHSLGVPKRLADDIAMTWHIFLAVPPVASTSAPVVTPFPSCSSTLAYNPTRHQGPLQRATCTHAQFERCEAVASKLWGDARSGCKRALARLWLCHGTLLAVRSVASTSTSGLRGRPPRSTAGFGSGTGNLVVPVAQQVISSLA